jgi:hypothetical protein
VENGPRSPKTALNRTTIARNAAVKPAPLVRHTVESEGRGQDSKLYAESQLRALRELAL